MTTTVKSRGVGQNGHVCPYCSAEKCRTYCTFLDWRNHLLDTHEHCLEDDDPLRDHRLPSAFLTPKAPRLTETSHRVGAGWERSWRLGPGRGGGHTGRGQRTRILHAHEIQGLGLGIRGYYPGARLVEERPRQENGDAHHAPPQGSG